MATLYGPPRLKTYTTSRGITEVVATWHRQLLLQPNIASCTGIYQATVSLVLRRAGMSRLGDLRRQDPVQSYERKRPGEPLQIGTNKRGGGFKSEAQLPLLHWNVAPAFYASTCINCLRTWVGVCESPSTCEVGR
ncbi:hypothetical protein ACWA7J_09590 [Leptothrix sp. BB-4]